MLVAVDGVDTSDLELADLIALIASKARGERVLTVSRNAKARYRRDDRRQRADDARPRGGEDMGS